jgi:hypothetical protein
LIAPTSLPASGSEEQNVPRAAEHLRAPLPDLLRRPVGHHGDRRQRAAGQRQPDPRVPPEQLLERDRDTQPRSLEVLLRVEVQRVKTDLGGLLQDRPRGFLPLVPLRGGRPDHRLGEPVHPLPHLNQVIPEFERERRGILIAQCRLRYLVTRE